MSFYCEQDTPTLLLEIGKRTDELFLSLFKIHVKVVIINKLQFKLIFLFTSF